MKDKGNTVPTRLTLVTLLFPSTRWEVASDAVRMLMDYLGIGMFTSGIDINPA
jgi:hypothetical protein